MSITDTNEEAVVFLIFLLFSVEEDRDIPIILPDYTDSLPVLYPYHSVKTKFSLTYSYPDLFSANFENGYIKVSIERGQDIDKYIKHISDIRLNAHSFNFQLCQPIEARNNIYLSKPFLGLSLKWKHLKADANVSPSIVIFRDTMFPDNEIDSSLLGDIWDTLSVEYISNKFLLKPFISSLKKGVIIQYHNEDKGIRIKFGNPLSSKNISDIQIEEIGYFSPLFYIKTGKDDKVYLDTLVYMPFIYPDFSYIVHNYLEAGFLFMKFRFGRFNSIHFSNYNNKEGIFIPEFYNETIKGISFSLSKGNNNLGIFLGKKDTINIGGLKFNAKRKIHIFRLSISGYAGYFSDTGHYATANISFGLKNRYSPVFGIKNIHIGKMMGKRFLPIFVYAGISYEGI